MMPLPADILTSPTAQPRHEVAPEGRSARRSKPYKPHTRAFAANTPKGLGTTGQQTSLPAGLPHLER